MTSEAATPKTSYANPNSNFHTKENVVLVMGSCGLDRLLYVPTYPQPDDKVRTTAYHEVGGGNAANTASAMALLSDASVFSQHDDNGKKKKSFKVQLATKLGNDYVGKQLIDELNRASVDTDSPLFQIGEEGTRTAFTSIIVSTDEHTRTCIHTPGTCGELTATDVTQNNNKMDEILENVIHVHFDCRHSSAELAIAKEAKKRRIPISVDIEKDRHSKDVDGLLELANLVFTNSQQIDRYLARLTKEYQLERGGIGCILDEPTISSNLSSGNDEDNHLLKLYANAIKPSVFFNRHFGQADKQVIITKGSLGALHVSCRSFEKLQVAPNSDSSSAINEVDISPISNNGAADESSHNQTIRVQHKFTDQIMPKETSDTTCSTQLTSAIFKAEYEITTVGVLSDVSIVDTTGAGDAFIGGYLLLHLNIQQLRLQQQQRHILASAADKDDDATKDFGNDNQLSGEGDQIIETCLKFASWVGGKKLAGPGSRTALPKGWEVDENLGCNLHQIRQSLSNVITTFHK